MLRSIKQFKLQFLSVILLAILSVTVYSGLEGVWKGIEYEFSSFADETNLADEWILASYFTDNDLSEIRNTEGVSDLSPRLRLSVSVTDINGKTSYISLDTAGNENVSKMYVIEGDGYNSAIRNAVWIDTEYAGKNNISVGDSINLTFNGKTTEAEVKGLILSSERTHFVGTSDYYIPDHERYGYGYMSNDVARSFDIMINCNLLEIKSNGEALKKNINDILGERFLAYYNRDTLFDVSFVINQTGNLKRMSILFSSLFILLSVLSMHTTIKRLIDAQSSDIASLKALGFSNRSLIVYYSLYGFSVSVIGTLIGYVCSFPFSYIIQNTQKAIITMPEWPVKHTPGTLIVIFLLILLSVTTSVLAAKKTLTGLPAEYMQNRIRHKTILPEKISRLWNKMSFGMKWTLRDASAHKTRIMLGIISVCGSFMLLVIGFGMPDSIASFTEKTYTDEFVYGYKLTLNTNCTAEDVARLKEELNGQLVENVQCKVNYGKDGVCFKPVTVFSAGEYINLRTTADEPLTGNGIYITEGMAEALDLSIGESVELFPSFSDKSYILDIAGIIPSSMPQSLYIMDSCWINAGATFTPSAMMVGWNVKENDLKSDNRISGIVSSLQQRDNLNAFKTSFSGIFNLMKIVAFVLVVIVLYNLSILSFLERSKEYNTFRVLGFHYNEIRLLSSFENVIILGIGTLFGLPLGIKFLDIYCSTFSNDTLKIYPHITSPDLIAVCLTVSLCTIVTTLLLSLKIRRIDMVMALKE